MEIIFGDSSGDVVAEEVEQFGVAFEFGGELSCIVLDLLFQIIVFANLCCFQVSEFFVKNDA